MEQKSLYKDKSFELQISGIQKPKFIMQRGRNFTIIKESINKDDRDNIGLIINKNEEEDLIIKNNINEDLPQLGGGENYYNKYLKYKNKYLALKNKLS
jgi:hypothetical protein